MSLSNLSSYAKPYNLSGLSAGDFDTLTINGNPVILANLFNKITDTSDDIVEGVVNRFDHITSTAPLVRTGDNLEMAPAGASASGYLSQADWITFNAKQSLLSWTLPLSNTGNTISMTQAGIASNGWLSSTDFNTFNTASGLWSQSGGFIRNNVAYPLYIAGNITSTGIIDAATYLKINGSVLSDNFRNLYTAAITATNNIISGGYVDALAYRVNGSVLSDISRNLSAAAISATGNISTSAAITATGNISTSAAISATGNITSGNIIHSDYVVNANGYLKMNSLVLSDGFRNLSTGTISATGLIETSNNINLTSSSYTYQIGGYKILSLRGSDLSIGAYGYNAAFHNGLENTIVGRNVLYIYQLNGSVLVNQNTVLGAHASENITQGDYNVSVGFACNYLSSSLGANNVLVGAYAAYKLTGGGNVVIGRDAFKNATNALGNVVIGYFAGDSPYITTASYNVLIGQGAGSAIGADRCVCIGIDSGRYARSGYTIAIGAGALYNCTTGVANTVIGADAGRNINTGGYNTLLGYDCGYAGAMAECTAVGYQALRNTYSSSNCGFGNQAGKIITSGTHNSYFGYIANGTDGTISGNSCFGSFATAKNGGFCSNFGYNATSGYNYYQVCLGYNANAVWDDVPYGHYLNTNCATMSGGSVMYFDSGTGRFGGLASSIRYKKNVRSLATEIPVLRVLDCEPVMYDSKDGKRCRCIGLIAEKVDLIISELVPKNAEGQCESVDYPQLATLLLGVCKDLNNRLRVVESALNS